MSVVTKFSGENAFDPSLLETMGKAYQLGCIALNGRPATDREKLARLIVEMARDGEHSTSDLCSKAANQITPPN